jgi:glycosyltransferase involved in cell wall biosynthesis
LEVLQSRGVHCVVNQMDPNRVEVDLVREEERSWPGWVVDKIQVPEEYFRRREREWEVADRVVVNSDYCRQALESQGVPSEKLVVIPLSYDSDMPSFVRTPRTSGPLHFLWLGQVILRKGIQYLIEAAKLLQKESIYIDVVGPLGISREAIASAPPNVTFHGRVSRNQVATWYQRSDVFVLPTLSDGFGITQLEAMSHGLPVICTPCCGEVVTNGEDGLVVSPRDMQALANAMSRYVFDRHLLGEHQVAARRKAAQFSLGRLANNLLSLETLLMNPPEITEITTLGPNHD